MTRSELQSAINEEMQGQLGKFHCTRGKLRYEGVVALSGERDDEQSFLIWDTDKQLGTLASQFLRMAPEMAGFAVSLANGKFVWELFTQDVLAERDRRVAEERRKDAIQQKDVLKEKLIRQTQKYGTILAQKVADQLKLSALTYAHRDYCGMGLEYKDGCYMYGEVQDGVLEVALTFEGKNEFVEWLAEQSDASLSRLDEENSWFWGNQTVNRGRLEEFVSGQ